MCVSAHTRSIRELASKILSLASPVASSLPLVARLCTRASLCTASFAMHACWYTHPRSRDRSWSDLPPLFTSLRARGKPLLLPLLLPSFSLSFFSFSFFFFFFYVSIFPSFLSVLPIHRFLLSPPSLPRCPPERDSRKVFNPSRVVTRRRETFWMWNYG